MPGDTPGIARQVYNGYIGTCLSIHGFRYSEISYRFASRRLVENEKHLPKNHRGRREPPGWRSTSKSTARHDPSPGVPTRVMGRPSLAGERLPGGSSRNSLEYARRDKSLAGPAIF